MSREGCRCGLATKMIWKAVPSSGTCIRKGPLAKLRKCTQHETVCSGKMIEDCSKQLLSQR